MKKTYKLIDTGSVYVVQNPSIVHPETKEPIVKIGRTGKENPKSRIEELNKETGVVADFGVVSIKETNANKTVENLVHQYLNNERVNKKKEFFSVSPEEASAVVDKIDELVSANSYTTVESGTPVVFNDDEVDPKYHYEGIMYDPFNAVFEYHHDKEDPPEGLDPEKWKKTRP